MSRVPTEDRARAVHVGTEWVNSRTFAVTVDGHDLIHVRNGEDWVLRKSSYRKLRLAPDWVAARLTACGFAVQRAEPIGRMSVIVADRP